jgi:hypothetical protein
MCMYAYTHTCIHTYSTFTCIYIAPYGLRYEARATSAHVHIELLFLYQCFSKYIQTCSVHACYIHAHTHAQKRTCIHTYVHACRHTYIQVCVYFTAFICKRMPESTNTRVHAFTHIASILYIFTHTHRHTHALMIKASPTPLFLLQLSHTCIHT